MQLEKKLYMAFFFRPRRTAGLFSLFWALLLSLNSSASSGFCSGAVLHENTVALRPSMVAEFARRLIPPGSHQRLVVFADYDGTLVGFKLRPEMAVLPLLDRARVERWSRLPWLELVIVSGRDSAFLDSQFTGLSLEKAAEHGAEYFNGREWRSRIDTPPSAWLPRVQDLLRQASTQISGSFIEMKKQALVLHYRESNLAEADDVALKITRELQAQLQGLPVVVSPGNKIIEVKAKAANKGAFVTWFMSRQDKKRRSVLAVGDDRTDEDMFKALGSRGFSLHVGKGPTAARFRLPQQEGLIEFLDLVFNEIEEYQK